MRTRDPDKTEASLGSRDLVVEQVPVSSLKPYANNPRTHTKKQIRQIAESIKTFGWMNPVLVDANDRIIAGHGRVEAAKLLGIPTVPILRIEDLSEAQLKAYVIADKPFVYRDPPRINRRRPRRSASPSLVHRSLSGAPRCRIVFSTLGHEGELVGVFQKPNRADG